ncbi:MAG: magnesium transporter [Halodesulfurarchaeum sp.]
MSVVEVARRAVREGFLPLAVSAVGGLFAGLVLGGMTEDLEVVRGLLVLVPALLATRGNVYGAFAARLASGLHQGIVEPHVSIADERLRAATAAATSNNLLASGFAAVLTFLALSWLPGDPAPLGSLVGIALIAAFLAGIALTVVVVLVMFLGYRKGVNPDTLVGPLVTTTGDVIGMAFLLFAVEVIRRAGGL